MFKIIRKIFFYAILPLAIWILPKFADKIIASTNAAIHSPASGAIVYFVGTIVVFIVVILVIFLLIVCLKR